jgi:hypothetical protein
MRKFRGANCTAVVKLAKKAMRTKFGTKLRPDFEIDSWFGFSSDGGAPAIEHKPASVEPVTLAEELNDEIPSWVTEETSAA